MYAVAKKLFLLAYVNKLLFKNGWLALKYALSATTALCSQWEEREEDPGVWPTNAPSPACSVEWECSFNMPKCHWILPVSVNRAGVITDLAGYVLRSAPSSTQVVPFKNYLLVIYILVLANNSCLFYTIQNTPIGWCD